MSSSKAQTQSALERAAALTKPLKRSTDPPPDPQQKGLLLRGTGAYTRPTSTGGPSSSMPSRGAAAARPGPGPSAGLAGPSAGLAGPAGLAAATAYMKKTGGAGAAPAPILIPSAGAYMKQGKKVHESPSSSSLSSEEEVVPRATGLQRSRPLVAEAGAAYLKKPGPVATLMRKAPLTKSALNARSIDELTSSSNTSSPASTPRRALTKDGFKLSKSETGAVVVVAGPTASSSSSGGYMKKHPAPVTSLSSSPVSTPRGGASGLTRDKGAATLNPLSARSSTSADSSRRQPPQRSKAVASLTELLSNSGESDELSVTTPTESVSSRGTMGSAIGRSGRIELGGGLAALLGANVMTPRVGAATAASAAAESAPLSDSSSVVEGEEILNKSTSTVSGGSGAAVGSRRQSASSVASSSSRSSKHARRADEPKGKIASLRTSTLAKEPPRRFGGAIVASLDDYNDSDSLVDSPAAPQNGSKSSSVIEDEEIIEEEVEEDIGGGRFGNIVSLEDYDVSFEEVKAKPAPPPQQQPKTIPVQEKFGIVMGLSDVEDDEEDEIEAEEIAVEEEEEVVEDEVGDEIGSASHESEEYIFEEERNASVSSDRSDKHASKPLPPLPARVAALSVPTPAPAPAPLPASPVVKPLAPPPLLPESPKQQQQQQHYQQQPQYLAPRSAPAAASKSVAVQADSALRSAEEDLAAYASRTVFGALGLGHEPQQQARKPPSLDVWASLLDAEPSPIAQHVIGPALSGEAPAFLPGLLAANDLYRRYLAMINRFVATNKLQQAQSLEAQGNARPYHYTDLAEVKHYIASNKPKVRSLQEALAEVQEQEG